jgi:hypothetical protein
MKYLDKLLRKVCPTSESEIDFPCALAICKLDPLPKHRAEQMFWRGVMSREDTLRILAAL